MDVAKKFINFINIWYTRYLLATELYMVEPWEKVVIHIIFGLIFWILWYFNYHFVINTIGQLRGGSTHYTEQML